MKTMKNIERLSFLVDPKNEYEKEMLYQALVYANITETETPSLDKEKRALEYYQSKIKHITRLKDPDIR